MLLVSWIMRLLIVLKLMEVIMLQSRRCALDNVERLDFWSQIFYLQQQQL